MKKNLLLAAFSAMAISLSASAANYIFHGNVSGDLLDVNNWYVSSGTPGIWGMPWNAYDAKSNPDQSWTFTQATELPGSSDNIGIGRWFNTGGGATLYAPKTVYLGTSATLGNVVWGRGSDGGTKNIIYVGSEGNADKDFNLVFKNYSAGTYSGAINNIYINSTASQKSYTLSVSDKVYLTNDTHNFGEYNFETGAKAFDKIEMKTLGMAYQQVKLNTYAKSYHISGNVIMNDGVDAKNATATANKWTIIVPDNALVEGTPLVQIDGKLIRREDEGFILSTIVFDFKWNELTEGEYILMSVTGGLEGFTKEGGGIFLSEIDESIWSTKWVGNNLILSSVPEPAAFAAIFASAALALAAFRKRK